MTKEELIKQLQELSALKDHEVEHVKADTLLLEFIADDEIKAAYEKVGRWYS